MDLELLLVILVDGLVYSSYLFLVAVGLTVIFGVQKVLNVTHGSFYAFGAYLSAYLIGLWAKAELPDAGGPQAPHADGGGVARASAAGGAEGVCALEGHERRAPEAARGRADAGGGGEDAAQERGAQPGDAEGALQRLLRRGRGS